MRKTIKVLKFPKIGKFGGYDKSVAIYDFDPGDQKEATMCMKIRTFAYNEGLGCPFYLHTKVDWAEAKDIFAWQFCVGWKTGLEDYNKQVGDTSLFLAWWSLMAEVHVEVEGPQICQINRWNNSFQNMYGMYGQQSIVWPPGPS